jgi:hypothetical protein
MAVSPLPIVNGYWFTLADLPKLVVQNYYPERTVGESAVIRAYLENHGGEYERFGFSVRVGQSLTPDPSHLIGVQKSMIYSSRKRVDLVGVLGNVHTLIEAKRRIEPGAIGQIQTYRLLYLEDNPDVEVGRLLLIGRYTDGDTQRSANAHGVDVLIYPETTA